MSIYCCFDNSWPKAHREEYRTRGFPCHRHSSHLSPYASFLRFPRPIPNRHDGRIPFLRLGCSCKMYVQHKKAYLYRNNLKMHISRRISTKCMFFPFQCINLLVFSAYALHISAFFHAWMHAHFRFLVHEQSGLRLTPKATTKTESIASIFPWRVLRRTE